MSFSLLSARHSLKILFVDKYICYFFTDRLNDFAGLNAGIL